MTRRQALSRAIGIAVAAAAVVVGIANPGIAQEPAGTSAEAIKVRGHWTLTIRNSDGSVAGRVEFDNALVPDGGALLSRLLGRRSALSQPPDDAWRVTIAGSSESYQIYEGTLHPALKRPGDFDGLSVTVPASGPNASRLLLVGTARATEAQSITAVTTAIAHMDQKTGMYLSAIPFTGHVLSAPATVVPGQSIDVTVVISFS
jgi:hypothetical protein